MCINHLQHKTLADSRMHTHNGNRKTKQSNSTRKAADGAYAYTQTKSACHKTVPSTTSKQPHRKQRRTASNQYTTPQEKTRQKDMKQKSESYMDQNKQATCQAPKPQLRPNEQASKRKGQGASSTQQREVIILYHWFSDTVLEH